MTEHDFVGGIDLGGTKVLSLCLDSQLEIVGQDQRPTGAERGLDAVLDTMAASLTQARGEHRLTAIGISTPGPSQPRLGIVTSPPNLPGWRDVPLTALMSQKLGLPCWIENDANAAAVAEHRLGAGRGSDHVILVTLGTGAGGGLILNGQLYDGASGGAGEIGHIQLEPDGPIRGCGRRGCMETLVAGVGFAREAQKIVASEPDGLVAQLAHAEGVAPDARILDLAAQQGDALADAVIRRAGHYLGAGLTSLVDIFNPQLIVIGGSLRKMGQRYIGTAIEVVKREAYRQHLADLRIVEAELGDESPAIGAALIALEKLQAS